MKKAIFLVEDIRDGEIITLLEQLYGKLIVKLHEERLPFVWISETARVLNRCPSDYIVFRRAKDFINDVENGVPIPDMVDIFYFISTWLNLRTFHITNFFALDPIITDFLVLNDIPIIIDGSMEGDEIYESSYSLFENNPEQFKNDKNLYFRGLENLKFYVVGGGLTTDYRSYRRRAVNVAHTSFPTAFFHIAYCNSPIHSRSIEKKDIVFDTIRKKQITPTTAIWMAFCKNPRLTRILFQLWADKENLTQFGRYSRLIPARDAFLQEAKKAGIFSRYPDKLNFITDQMLENLNSIQHIDLDENSQSVMSNFVGVPFATDAMFHIILETCFINSGEDFSCTPSMLTEKTSMAILSGVPFITLGGHKIKHLLKSLGFREYIGLELPDIEQQNFFDELEYVVEKVKAIKDLPLAKKQRLYDLWKETIIYNYENYLSLDTKKSYLQFLNHPL